MSSGMEKQQYHRLVPSKCSVPSNYLLSGDHYTYATVLPCSVNKKKSSIV